MSTAVAPKPAVQTTGAETRLVLQNVPWDLYERLRDAHDSPGVRMTYDRGRLELMAPSMRHEGCAARFDILIYELAKVLGFPCKPLRSTTWKKPDASGKEADSCFYLAHAPRMRGKKTVDLALDPPPDLAIEVEISPPSSDIESVYAALGVPEIWRFDSEALRVLLQQEDGSYVESNQSAALPFLPLEDVVRLLDEAEALDDDPRWGAQVAQWAQAELAPRYRQQG